jgi:hypothetical protein
LKVSAVRNGATAASSRKSYSLVSTNRNTLLGLVLVSAHRMDLEILVP